ncbi:hypothetical protein D3C80_1781830 [compost metagenome]
MTGAWPPSSISTGFMAAPASWLKCLPTATDPVKVTMRVTGDSIRVEDTSAGLPNTRFNTPLGKPARSKH